MDDGFEGFILKRWIMKFLTLFLYTLLLGSFVEWNYLSDDVQVELTNTPLYVGTVRHSWFSPEDNRQLIVNRAYELWGIDFVIMIECENGNRNPNAISKTHDYWICQLNYKYNKEFINSEEFKDVYKQLEYCYNKWKANPKLWNWPNRRIKWQLCKDYVLNRFIINDERA